MKKLAYSIAILLAACACTKEEFVDVNDAPAGTITFTATMEGNTDTKSLLGEGSSILWSKTDSISVLDVNSSPANSKFILESGEGTTTATFSGSCPSSSTGYFAVYPYNKADSISGTNEVTVRWDGADQKAVKSFSTTTEDGVLDTYFPQGSPMIAYGAAPEAGIHDVSLSFKNVCSYLKLTLATKVAGITIKANTDTDVIAAEDVTISWSDDTPTVTAVSNGSSEIHLTGSTGGSLEPGVYYIAILPGSLTTGITMTLISSVDSGESGIWTKTGSSQSTLARGKVYNLGDFAVPSWIKLAGSGTESDPYLIEDYTDFQIMEVSVAYNLSNSRKAFYKQTADIDFEGKSLNPIGNYTNPFSGTYDGNSKTIKNEKITNPVVYHRRTSDERKGCGLFGIILNANIHDLTIQDPILPVADTRDFSFSPFAAVSYGASNGKNMITNCTCIGTWKLSLAESAKSEINSDGIIYGGFIGDNMSNATIEGCTSKMNVTVAEDGFNACLTAGGVIGSAVGLHTSNSMGTTVNTLVELSNCRNEGSLEVDFKEATSGEYFPCAGGLIGATTRISGTNCATCHLTNCVNSGKIECLAKNANAYAAGFVSIMNTDGYGLIDSVYPEIVNCINSGPVHADVTGSGTAYAGGFIAKGYDDDTKITVCGNCGSVTGGYNTPFDATGESTLKYCWDTYQPVSDYNKGSVSVNWNYAADKAAVATTQNSIITGITIYKSWKVNEDGNLDLDF